MKLRALLAGLPLLVLASSQAATFTVATLADSGPGSLRQAIVDANANPGEDVIAFATNGTITLTTPLPEVTVNLSISGPGTNQLTISGNNDVEVFSFNARTTNSLSGLTVANGLATGNANGAGIASAGGLTLRNCVLLNNTNLGGWGGAIFNSGTLNIINCVFLGNQTAGAAGQGGAYNSDFSCGGLMGCGGGGGAGMGGAVFTTSGAIFILNSSFITNRAVGGNGGNIRDDGCGGGGGINAGAGNFNAFGSGGNGGFGGGGGGGSAYGYPGHGGSGGFGGGNGGTGGGGGPQNGGAGSGIGGAIFLNTGTATIINCVFTDNQVSGAQALGPDFYNYAGAVLPILSATTLGGGTVLVDPPSPPYLSNSVATVTAMPDPGWKLLNCLGDASGTNETLIINMTRNKYVSAVFGSQLTTTALVFVDPQSDYYPYGTLLKLTALPPAGTYFISWSGDAGGTNNPTSVTVTNPNQSFSCNLGTLNASNYALTVVENGAGHTMRTPSGNYYPLNASVLLQAVPDPAQDFIGWSGGATGTENPLLISMVQTTVIAANFTKRPSLRVGTPLEGLTEDGFRLTVTGEFGIANAILGSTNLADWTLIGTVTNIYGTVQFTDSSATNLTHAFYRSVSDP